MIADLAGRLARYTEALRRFDWSHEFSDDGEVRRRGVKALRALRDEQAIVDPSFEIWNQHCPPQCVNGLHYG